MRRSAKDTRRWREGLNKHDIHQNPARADPGSRARVTLTDHPIPLPARGDPPPRRAHGRLRGIGRVGLGVDEQTNATREPDAFETHCSAKCSGARRQADRGAYAGVWITAAAARPTTRRLIRAHPTIGRGPLLAAIQNVAETVALFDAAGRQTTARRTGLHRRYSRPRPHSRAEATITTSPRKYRAWLIRWEWATTATAAERPVMAVLRPQTASEQVRRIVEILYASERYEPDEMLATIRPRGWNPYRAQFVTVKISLPAGGTAHVPWLGRIVCGHNPCLIAHQARVWSPPDRPGQIAWDDESARPV
jgi:hypothetical protein